MAIFQKTSQAEEDLMLYRVIPGGIELVRVVHGMRLLSEL